jgi:hypothetical protein
VLPFKPLRRAVREALARRRITPHEAATLIPAEPVPTRSDLEDLVLDLIRKAGLQMPRVNERLANGLVPDFRWPDQRLILEADGLTWHGDPVLRVSYAQGTNQPEQTIERLKRAGAPIRESPGSGRAPTASPARGSPPTPVA